MKLSTKIESILFFKGEAVSVKQLSGFLDVEEKEVIDALMELKNDLQGRGIRLVTNEGRVMLGTSPEMHETIESMKKEELSKELGKASLETLSIVLYKSPVRKADIDYIRGVNSASILRNLLVRGLIERSSDESNQRSFSYVPTLELLSYLGISDLKELPEYEKVRNEVENHSETKDEPENVEGDDSEVDEDETSE